MATSITSMSSVFNEVSTSALAYAVDDVTTDINTESPFDSPQFENSFLYSNVSLLGNGTVDFLNDSFFSDDNNTTMPPRNMSMRRKSPGRDIGMEVQIPIYIIIFVLSVVGNILVIVTVIQNKKMRSVTNVFLLNLAVSDLLLSVFCMPFTLVPLFLQNFIFGEVMCVAIRYMQGVSVAASCFTLVSISLERYFAICHPLKSRRWQTLSHSYKAIAVCWILALSLMMPVAIYHDLIKIGPSRHICVEIWPSNDGSKAYTVALNLSMLVLPVIIMTWAYGRVSYTLWLGMRMEDKQNKESSANYNSSNGVSIYINNKKVCGGSEDTNPITTVSNSSSNNSNIVFVSTKPASVSRPFRRIDAHRAMRQSNSEKSRAAKKRVIKMLFIIVLEFFIFWTPVYVLSTWMTFDIHHARMHLAPKIKSLLHLLSYVSACCNPITYCFMNKNFRQSFLLAFRCRTRRHIYVNKSQMSFTGNSISTTRAAQSRATSYDKINDSDDISENGL